MGNFVSLVTKLKQWLILNWLATSCSLDKNPATHWTKFFRYNYDLIKYLIDFVRLANQ